jgi:hypothetical protein
VAKRKQKLRQKLIAEFLFWLHVLISVVILFMGLFVAWYWVIVVLLLLRLHQIILHGCVVTLLAQKEGAMPKGMVFYQLMAKRFFGYRLKKRYVKPTLIIHYCAALGIAIAAGHYNFGLHF